MRDKPLLPCLKEKKRYLAYEIISNEQFNASDVSNAIYDSSLNYLGSKGVGEAGINVLKETYSNNKGLIRVSHTKVHDVKAALALIKAINRKEAIVRSIGMSGIIDKAKKKYTGMVA